MATIDEIKRNMNETPLGERYCAFRNFMVFRGNGIRGEDILHTPKRKQNVEIS